MRGKRHPRNVQRSIAITGTLYYRIKAFCDETDAPIHKFVDRALREYMALKRPYPRRFRFRPHHVGCKARQEDHVLCPI